MVFDKQWFQQNNDRLCWLANNSITKYWFRWLLRIHKDISWNEKIEEIMPNAFTYGKKLILTDCIKLKRQGWVVYDENKRYHRRLKGKCLMEKKLVWWQTTDFRTHEKFGKRLYYGLKPLWYLLHFWDWSTSIQPALNCGFDTLTAYPQAGGGGGNTTCDGYINGGSNGNANWTTCRNATTGTAYPTEDEYFFVYAGNPAGYYLRRGFFTFDTSSIGVGSTVSSCKLSLRGVSVSGNCVAHVVVSTQANANDLVGTDFDNRGSTSFGSFSYSTWSTSGYNELSLNASGISSLVLNGVSMFATVEGHDYDNSTPSSVYNMECRFADYTGTDNDPKLVVTYTLPIVTPTVSTSACDQILIYSVRGNGNITNTGGENCTRRGFCYKEGTSGDPTTSDSTAYDDSSYGTGAYTKVITGLKPNTTYRVRAYAVNSAGTGYGTTVSVTTDQSGRFFILFS